MYGVATISRLSKIIGLFCRIQSLLWGYFAKESYSFKEPTNRSHNIVMAACKFMHAYIYIYIYIYIYTYVCIYINRQTYLYDIHNLYDIHILGARPSDDISYRNDLSVSLSLAHTHNQSLLALNMFNVHVWGGYD